MKFLATRRRLCLVAVTFSLLFALTACSPRRVVLKTIPAEAIPKELWDSIQSFAPSMGTEAKPLVSDMVCRVYEVRDGRQLAAFTFTRAWKTGEGAETVFCIHTAGIDETGKMTPPYGIGTGVLESFILFRGGHTLSARPSAIAESTYFLNASGYCLDGRVKAIQGTTTEGLTVKTKPSGGFWHLQLDDTGPTDTWARISAIDKSGEPVADLTIYQRVGNQLRQIR